MSWKVVDHKTRTWPGDKSGCEFIVVVARGEKRREIVVSAGHWAEYKVGQEISLP